MSIESLTGIIEEWLTRDRNNRGASINTLSGIVVVLNRLCEKAPLTDEDVITTGGQLIGGRGKHLKDTLQKYGIRNDLLSDGVTTRSTQRFRDFLVAIDYGMALSGLNEAERTEAVSLLMKPVERWIIQLSPHEPLQVDLSGHSSLTTMVSTILNEARSRSKGRVEQHLVGAKLEERFGREKINRQRAYAADVQTSRSGDFAVGKTVYHVTASPMPGLGPKIVANLMGGYSPVLIVPEAAMERARNLMRDLNLDGKLEIFSLEAFLTQNILEMADDNGVDHSTMLERVLSIYNERIEETETDQSLRIKYGDGDN